MPDLRHRPTRYAIALTSVVALAAVGASHFDVYLGEDPMVLAAQSQTSNLEGKLSELLARLRDTQAQLDAAKAAKAKAADAAVLAASTTVLAGSSGKAASCATYPDQESAQAAFQANPLTLRVLDGDGDGIACEQLKSSAPPQILRVVEPVVPKQDPAPPAGPVKPSTPSKAQILASGFHFGMMAATTEEYDTVEASLAWDTTVNGFFGGFDTPFNADRVTERWRRGEVPMLTWESRPLDGVETTPQDVYALRHIIDGSFDAYITQYAQDVKALGLPLIIRFDQEMNGDWYRWGTYRSTVGNQPGEYVQAWKRVHDIFEQQGANDQVIWLWSPNRVDNIASFPAISNYYPGNTYVDWLGMTGYLRSEDRTPATFAGTYDRTLAALRAVAPGKPILLAEVGATEDGGHKLDWMKTFFPGLKANPDVVGFVWFNYAVTSAGNTNDWRLTSSSGVFDQFRTDLKLSGFGREHGKRPLLVPRTPAPTPPSPVGAQSVAPATTTTTAPRSSTTTTTTTIRPTRPTTTTTIAATTTTTTSGSGRRRRS